MRIVNILLCLVFSAIAIYYSVILSSLISSKLVYAVLLFFGFMVAFTLIILLLSVRLMDNNIHPFWFSGYHLLFCKYRTVIHNNLGIFHIRCSSSDTYTLVRIGSLYMKYIKDFSVTDDISNTIREINEELDLIYTRKLRKLRAIEDDKLRKKKCIDQLKQWDGYLDKETRRDSKIKKIV